MSEQTGFFTSLIHGAPRQRLPLLAGVVVFVLLGGLLIGRVVLRQPRPGPAQTPGVTPTAPWLAPPAGPAAAPVTGELALGDFRLVVPPGWQRRPDLEEQGPGTKLFLAGPTVGKGQVYIGIDVYPLPPGMALADFIKRYSSTWVGLGVIADKQASLCGKPARMLSMSDGSVDKLFLVSVWRNHGYTVGLFGPSGQAEANVKVFKTVVDTFQLYE